MSFDAANRQVLVRGQPTTLQKKAFAILELLARRSPQFVAREHLLAEIWRNKVVEPRTIDVHMGTIRRALKAAQSRCHILTRHGVGYAIIDTQQGATNT